MKKTKAKLPPDKVVVRDGRVVLLEEWTMYNLKTEMTFKASFDEKTMDFTASVFDPEHGGPGPKAEKSIEAALDGLLHPDIARNIIKLFKLRNPTELEIRYFCHCKGDGLKVIFE